MGRIFKGFANSNKPQQGSYAQSDCLHLKQMTELAGKMCHLTYEKWYTICKTISHKPRNIIYQVSKILIHKVK